MALKKRRKKGLPQIPRSGAGRKKEIKRFVLEKWTVGNEPDDVLRSNEVAFVVKTSGGTPLNVTDLNKLHRLLQHELRALGHKLVRKGQELDPEPKKPAQEDPEPEAEPEAEGEGEGEGEGEAEVADEQDHAEVAAPPEPEQASNSADPDDPTEHQN